MNTDDIRKDITSKLDGTIGTSILYLINNIAKNMMLKMKKIYSWDFFRFEVSIDHNKTNLAFCIWFMHLDNCLNKINILNKRIQKQILIHKTNTMA